MMYDLAVIGGGVNGCGIARDAAGRGLKVHLSEMNDLASGTSSWSTKLIHGGLRYLEFYEFRLVRESLVEREIVWRMAPHIVEPLRFVLPHHRGLRPAWLLRLGLFLYDHIGGRKLLPPTRTVDLTRDVAGAPLKAGMFRRGFEYSDARVDDARLVVLTARDAADRGATIATRTRVVAAERLADHWRVTLEDADGGRGEITARVLVNAAGPWVADVVGDVLASKTPAKVRLVKGSHIVTRRLFDHDRAYIFQNADGRVIFAIPYQGDFTLIGTTDVDFRDDPAAARCSQEETAYLIAAASEYFARPIGRDDVVWSFSGVRPLYDDGASEAKAATRDYVLDLDAAAGRAPVLSIYGGKLTTYRRLAEAVLKKLAPLLPALSAAKAGWTAEATLPGGDFPVEGREALIAATIRERPFLAPDLVRRLVSTYGTRAARIIGETKSAAGLGRDFGAGLSEREVCYLMAEEWARTAEDVVWRRTKLGLRMSPAEIADLDAFMATMRAA
ncbi:MAG: glycerol-3-phosphate dehydrogenase [Siculibacillus sp.]|nr:glycerol-3-phosphate dehydrogenase [Siculibacillus sp.]